jgi:hypothetical protein
MGVAIHFHMEAKAARCDRWKLVRIDGSCTALTARKSGPKKIPTNMKAHALWTPRASQASIISWIGFGAMVCSVDDVERMARKRESGDG